MPSRKRAKGKARKAKARESNCNLILHNDSVCRHGCEIISKVDVCYKFVEQLEVEIKTTIDSMPEGTALSLSEGTIKRLKERKEYNKIWNDDSEDTLQKIRALFINLGTNLLSLSRDQIQFTELEFAMATIVAIVTISSHHDYDVRKALDVIKSRNSLRDLSNAQLYDIIKYFYKRTPCQCLKKLYLHERSTPRLAACNHCKVKKDRSRQLYLCNGCRYAYYCGVE